MRKKPEGTHSVGVHHQYCGQLGKQANCQVAVTLSVANHHASLPIAYRLYLPKVWADDAQRRDKAHVPEAIRFKTKPQIALAQLGAALAAGVARGVVLMDASYGTNSALRAGIGALALTYVAAILPTVKVRAVADPDRRVSAKALALSLPKHAWRTITWRDGSAAPLRSRFARVRVRTAPSTGAAARPQETLLIEWPDGDTAPTKYWLSNIAETMSLRRLVDIAKLRWRIERDYQDLKQEIGLGHYEGRGSSGRKMGASIDRGSRMIGRNPMCARMCRSMSMPGATSMSSSPSAVRAKTQRSVHRARSGRAGQRIRR
jgi:SRSO17 transposase